MTAPDWVTPNIMDDLRKLKDFGFEIMFEVYKHQEKSRLQGGNANCQFFKSSIWILPVG